jgi:hypothetical protein
MTELANWPQSQGGGAGASGDAIAPLPTRFGLVPATAAQNGLIVQRPDDNAWGIAQVYGAAQFIEFLRKGLPAGGVSPNDLVLFRVDREANVGLAGGMHIATGLRQDAGYVAPGTGQIWLQPFVNVRGIVWSPPAGQTLNFLEWQAPGPGNLRGKISPQGDIAVFDDTGGIPVAQLYARTVAPFGARAILRTGDPATRALYLLADAAQAQNIMEIADSAANVLWWVDAAGSMNFKPLAGQLGPVAQWLGNPGNKRGDISAKGDISTYDDAGGTPLAVVYARTSPEFGARAILKAGDPAARALYLQAAPAQTQDIAQAADSAGAVLWRIGHAGIAMVRVSHSVAQPLGASADVAIAFDTEQFDTDAMHDTASNNQRLVATTPGVYLITASITIAANATGVRQLYLKHSGGAVIAQDLRNPAATGATQIGLTGCYKFAAGEYVTVQAVQTSAGSLNATQVSAAMIYQGAG